jgi:hypothetical protein
MKTLSILIINTFLLFFWGGVGGGKMHRWVSDMDHWLRTTTRAIGCNVRDGSPYSLILRGRHFWVVHPFTLVDLLNQQKRWAIGLLEVVFSKFSPLTFVISHDKA